ncbi:MAG: LamG-like jellyroll fold domain-containing protein [Planctomycetota bacterium]
MKYAFVLSSLCLYLQMAAAQVPDPRHMANGRIIPSEGYADQPYIVKADDGSWVCVITTGNGIEGAPGQHVVSIRTPDKGRSWEKPVDLEPANGPEASYAVLLKVPSGRIYAFYNHNTDRVTEVKREDKGAYKRVDSLGHYVFKYSDDHGKTWSSQRYDVPVREFQSDRNNVYGGRLRFFWNVGRPLIVGSNAILTLHKVGAMGNGFFAQSEGALLRSKNILTEQDPKRITFETLPDGDTGLRTPPNGGRVAEEQSVVALSDGSLYCIYRTIDGWPASAYSRNGGQNWTTPAYATYSPNGKRIKHPRAANFLWRCPNGMFLYWFHNHGGRFVGELGAAGKGGRSAYDDRNPAWLMAGREVNTPQGMQIEWSQPEILIYDDDPYLRMSYPDLVEEAGKFYITETQKTIGRVHEIPAQILDGLFNQFKTRDLATSNLALNVKRKLSPQVKMPLLPQFNQPNPKAEDRRIIDLRAGFSLDLWLEFDKGRAAQPVLDTRDSAGKGILVDYTDQGTIRIKLNDGRQEASWESDRNLLALAKPHHVVITVDGGPKIISFVVNGALCDGGDDRQFGWGRFASTLRTPNGSEMATLGQSVQSLRIYTRALRTSEAVGNFRAGLPL